MKYILEFINDTDNKVILGIYNRLTYSLRSYTDYMEDDILQHDNGYILTLSQARHIKKSLFSFSNDTAYPNILTYQNKIRIKHVKY